MTFYLCDRCNYSTCVKGAFKRHCTRKVECSPIFNNITQQDLYKKYFSTEDRIKCCAPSCSKYLKSERSKWAHEKNCRHMTAYKIQLAAEKAENEVREAAIAKGVSKEIEIIKREQYNAEIAAEIKKRVEVIVQKEIKD